MNIRVTGLDLIKCGRSRRGDGVDNDICNVNSRQVAAKAQMQRLAAEKFDLGACSSAQRRAKGGHGVIDHSLHFGAGHSRANLARGDRLAVMADVECISQFPGIALQSNGLHLARTRLTLSHVQRLHHPKFKITEVAGNIGHIRVPEGTLERQLKNRSATLGFSSVNCHCHIARAKKSIHGRLQIRLQRRGVITIGNGVAEAAIARAVEHGDLKAAARQCLIYNRRQHLKGTHAHKGAIKGNFIKIYFTTDGYRAYIGQSTAIARSRSM